MSTLQVRHLSEKTHQTLRVRAVKAGMSLSQYVAERLDEIAVAPTIDELFSEIDLMGATPFDVDAASILRTERDSRK